MHPAIIECIVGRVLILVVTKEHPCCFGNNFTNPIVVRIVDTYLGVVERDTNSIEIHIIRFMDRIGTRQFCLSVELAQGNAHREEKLERVRTKCCATGRCRAQIRESQPVLQRAEQ